MIIEKYADAILRNFVDSRDFVEDKLIDFANELEDLIRQDIRDSIISKN